MGIADAPPIAVTAGTEQRKTSISVIVTAFNEEQDLRSTILSAMEALRFVEGLDVEIVIVNDGSSDGTASVADALEREFPLVRCVHHKTNRGWGAAFRSGLEAARHDYLTWIPGDNLISIPMIREILKHVGQADLVCAFNVNTECRTRLRRLISSVYSFTYRTTFDLPLRSIHTTPVYPVKLLRETPLRSHGYSLASEIMVKLLRQGCTFQELPGYMNPSQNHSSALRIKNLIEVMYSYLRLIIEVYVRERAKYSRSPVRVIPNELRS